MNVAGSAMAVESRRPAVGTREDAWEAAAAHAECCSGSCQPSQAGTVQWIIPWQMWSTHLLVHGAKRCQGDANSSKECCCEEHTRTCLYTGLKVSRKTRASGQTHSGLQGKTQSGRCVLCRRSSMHQPAWQKQAAGRAHTAPHLPLLPGALPGHATCCLTSPAQPPNCDTPKAPQSSLPPCPPPCPPQLQNPEPTD